MVGSESRIGKTRFNRFVTQMHEVIVGCINTERMVVEIDPRSSKTFGPYATKFISYVGMCLLNAMFRLWLTNRMRLRRHRRTC